MSLSDADLSVVGPGAGAADDSVGARGRDGGSSGSGGSAGSGRSGRSGAEVTSSSAVAMMMFCGRGANASDGGCTSNCMHRKCPASHGAYIRGYS